MRFVITGTPRSGTRYAAKLMAAMGFPCDHEKTIRPSASVVNLARWPTLGIGESSWMAWSVLPLMVGYRVPVLHTVRNPWDVIDSLTNRNQILNPMVNSDAELQNVRVLINAYLPELFQLDERVDRAAALVLGWDRLIAEHAPERYVYHVEWMDVVMVRGMLNFIGAERGDDTIQAALTEVSTSTNSGITVDRVPGVSDPDVAKWVQQYAKENDVGRITTCKIRDVAGRQTPEELIERMDPELADQVNAFAALHGYPTYELSAVA